MDEYKNRLAHGTTAASYVCMGIVKCLHDLVVLNLAGDIQYADKSVEVSIVVLLGCLVVLDVQGLEVITLFKYSGIKCSVVETFA